MKSTKDSGIFQLSDGTWGYRFKIVLNGKTIDRRKLIDENGDHFRTKTAAIKARKAAILAEENKALSASKATAPKPSERRTIQEIYTEYCEKGRTDKAFTTKRKQDFFGTIICRPLLEIGLLMIFLLPKLTTIFQSYIMKKIVLMVIPSLF